MIDDMVGSNISDKIALPNLDTYLFTFNFNEFDYWRC